MPLPLFLTEDILWILTAYPSLGGNLFKQSVGVGDTPGNALPQFSGLGIATEFSARHVLAAGRDESGTGWGSRKKRTKDFQLDFCVKLH